MIIRCTFWALWRKLTNANTPTDAIGDDKDRMRYELPDTRYFLRALTDGYAYVVAREARDWELQPLGFSIEFCVFCVFVLNILRTHNLFVVFFVGVRRCV